MKSLGCVLGIVGFLVCVTSFVLFGTAIFRATEAHELRSIPLVPGEKVSTDLIRVDTSRFCMISVKAKVRSEQAEKKTGSEDYSLKFDFPFHYTVYDSAGKELYSQSHDFTHKSGNLTSYGEKQVNDQGGWAVLTIDYDKFPAPSSGELRIEAQLDPDKIYEATADLPQLLVYDRVSKHATSVVSGLVLLAGGGAMSLIGVVLFIIGLTSRRRITQ